MQCRSKIHSTLTLNSWANTLNSDFCFRFSIFQTPKFWLQLLAIPSKSLSTPILQSGCRVKSKIHMTLTFIWLLFDSVSFECQNFDSNFLQSVWLPWVPSPTLHLWCSVRGGCSTFRLILLLCNKKCTERQTRWRSENCCQELASQATTWNLQSCNTCPHSKVDHSYGTRWETVKK